MPPHWRTQVGPGRGPRPRGLQPLSQAGPHRFLAFCRGVERFSGRRQVSATAWRTESGAVVAYRPAVDWVTEWFGHDQVEHAAWLGAVGTSVATSLGVLALVREIPGLRKARDQARRVQARKVWFESGTDRARPVPDEDQCGHVLGMMRVNNGSDEVISWVEADWQPLYEAPYGHVTRIPHEPSDEDLTG